MSDNNLTGPYLLDNDRGGYDNGSDRPLYSYLPDNVNYLSYDRGYSRLLQSLR